MHRLFVALRPPEAIRAQLIALMSSVDEARWQNDEQLHITLRFIGEVNRNSAEDIALALNDIRQPPFEVSLRGVDVFTRKGRITALWAGLTPQEDLMALHRKVDQAAVRLGLPPDPRVYQPHLTLARFGNQGGNPGAFIAQHAGLSSARFQVDHFALFESHLGKGGAHYEEVARYPLTKRHMLRKSL
jgi:RNA 2',3'-cyclic 3'-phosphodiesterase